jgi:hypothetical protein
LNFANSPSVNELTGFLPFLKRRNIVEYYLPIMTKLGNLLLKVELVLNLCFAFHLQSFPQKGFLEPSLQYNPSRLGAVVVSELAGGLLVTTGLYYLWYRKHPRSKFHFFNDNAEWLQMDKMGHATTAYTIAAVQYDLMRWCGLKTGPSIASGSLTALGYMSIIEVLDGFSSKWGFSKGDMLANIIGSALFAAQQQGWGQQRISLQFSYHATIFPPYYPEELGNNGISRIIKDYNGQTYWLSINIKSFLPANAAYPAWLNFSLGYGAEGMIGARSNPDCLNGKAIPLFRRYRQFYLAPGFDFLKVPSNSELFNTAAYFTRFIEFPAPALEWNSLGKWKFHPLYF